MLIPTGDGERDGRVYARADLVQGWYAGSLSPEGGGRQVLGAEHWVDLTQPIYFTVLDVRTGEHGLSVWAPQAGTRILHQVHASVSYRKALDAPVWVASRMTFNEPMDYYRVDASFALRQRLTDINPQQREYLRPAQERLLYYTNERGEARRAVLRLPVGYEAGQRYPTVVGIYKGMSGNLHIFHGPLGNPMLYEGYATLWPDITISRMDDAGEIARMDVMAAVEAAIATGAVDGDRLALHGHSYGAFETLYIISQTDRFKVAEFYAGVGNHLSQCAAAHRGYPGMLVCESNQPYVSGPWWGHWDAYVKNLPLYHIKKIKTPLLLVHGTADTAVPFEQSVEMFNGLRRLRQAPVALLEYEGEEHSLSEKADEDHKRRQLALFNHYLKGGPAPEWWDMPPVGSAGH